MVLRVMIFRLYYAANLWSEIVVSFYLELGKKTDLIFNW
jgi:hypothetical protein